MGLRPVTGASFRPGLNPIGESLPSKG
jgi:hypothetical protein